MKGRRGRGGRTDLGNGGGRVGARGWGAEGGVANLAELGNHKVRHMVLQERKKRIQTHKDVNNQAFEEKNQ